MNLTLPPQNNKWVAQQILGNQAYQANTYSQILFERDFLVGTLVFERLDIFVLLKILKFAIFGRVVVLIRWLSAGR